MLDLFQTINSTLPLSNVGIVLVWAVIAGLVSMFVYRRWSNQQKLNALMEQIQQSQKELNQYEGNEFGEMLPLLKRNLSLSLKRVGLSLVPSLLAGLPLVLVMICLDADIKQSSAASPQLQHALAQPDGGSANESDLPAETDTLPTETDESHSLAPQDDYLGFGPTWMRSWIFVFMFISASSALAYRQFGGII